VGRRRARDIGWGGVSLVARATGLSRPTILAGLRELQLPAPQRAAAAQRIRRPGGGRRTVTATDPTLLAALMALIEPTTRGDLESPLRWTCKSTAKLADELTRQDHPVSDRTVATLLKDAGCSLLANRKTREGASQPDRDAQFAYLNACVARSHKRGQPGISVDTKGMATARATDGAGSMTSSTRHSAKPSPTACTVCWTIKACVSVGIDHDTAEFAVHSIRQWWMRMGRCRFSRAHTLLITADAGGSNSPRSRLWKRSLQTLADDLGLTLAVCHFLPGTSKWNKIEHRLFSFITHNWRGQPLISHQAIVNLIAATTTRTGLIVKAALDTHQYDTAIQVSDEDVARLHVTRTPFTGIGTTRSHFADDL
jgi:Rhodopirellula transposase DDE domain